jgi:hypothetical protein
MKTLIIPTEYPTEIQIPQDYPTPPEGSAFFINFFAFTPPKDWDAVRSLIEMDILTVSVIDNDTIFLQEGMPVLGEDEPEPVDYLDIFRIYWEKHPSTRPPGF